MLTSSSWVNWGKWKHWTKASDGFQLFVFVIKIKHLNTEFNFGYIIAVAIAIGDRRLLLKRLSAIDLWWKQQNRNHLLYLHVWLPIWMQTSEKTNSNKKNPSFALCKRHETCSINLFASSTLFQWDAIFPSIWTVCVFALNIHMVQCSLICCVGHRFCECWPFDFESAI